jgi:large subunit ribosomal protein L21
MQQARALLTGAAAAATAAAAPHHALRTPALLGSSGGGGRGALTAAPSPATQQQHQQHQQVRYKSSALARLRRLQRRRASRPGTQASWAAVRPLLDALKAGGGGGGAAATPPPALPPPRLVPSALPAPLSHQAIGGCGADAKEEEADDADSPPAQVSIVGRIAAPYLPPPPQDAFAVVEIGPFQYKVSAGDVVFHPRLKGCEVNDVLQLGRVLLAGGKGATAVGRPFVPGALVVAAVEEHFRDAKVRVFKKKKRKRYSKSYGHRSLVTALRVLEVRCAEVEVGVEAPAV